MVAPVTGPFTVTRQEKTLYGNYPSNWTGLYGIKTSRTWYRQKPPYSLPLLFRFSDQRVLKYETNVTGYWYRTIQDTYYESTMQSDAYNKAYERFKKALGDNAALSVTMAERKQAIEMISKRSTQLLRFVNALRRLDFSAAAEELKVPMPKKQKPRYVKGRRQPWEYSTLNDSGDRLVKRGKRFYLAGLTKAELARSRARLPKSPGLIPEGSSKALANNYLEFHFGWSPLIADIGNAVQVLQSGVPPAVVKGRATKRYTKSYDNVSGVAKSNFTHNVTQNVTLRAQVRITNPNLWLANQMGFVNPATVLWELVPYSFVVDWFVNVSDFLNSFTDFLGIELIDPSTTVFTRDLIAYRYDAYYSNGSYIWDRGLYQGVTVTRDPGSFPGPTLKVRPPWNVSPRRGLAAISLLIQKM